MVEPSILTLEWRVRPGEKWPDGRPYKSERHFLDFKVNGESLFVKLPAGDQVTPLGTRNNEAQLEIIEQLLLERPGEGQQGRVPLYVCAECGDYGCGFLSVAVERTPEGIVWRDFGDEYFEAMDDEDVVNLKPYEKRGPFLFDENEYRDAIRNRPSAAV